VKVTNRNNGRSVVVRINDRGPFIRGRVLDLSRAAAQNIGMVSSGTAKVCYESSAEAKSSAQSLRRMRRLLLPSIAGTTRLRLVNNPPSRTALLGVLSCADRSPAKATGEF